MFVISLKSKAHCKLHYNVDEQFSGSGTAIEWKIGYPAGVSQSDGSTAVSAADIIANFDLDAVTAGSYDHNLGYDTASAWSTTPQP